MIVKIGFGSGFKRVGFSSSKFYPLDLFSGEKQGAWYDPSDKSTLFQDVAGTVPVTADGDPVALMRDKSGNGNHATRTVSTSRPIYKTDGILHWLQFDGVDDYIASGDFNFDGSKIFCSTGLSWSGVGSGLYPAAFAVKDLTTAVGVTAGVYLGLYSELTPYLALMSFKGGTKNIYQKTPKRGEFNTNQLIHFEKGTINRFQSVPAMPVEESFPNPLLDTGAAQLVLGTGVQYSYFKGRMYGIVYIQGQIDIELMRSTNDYLANKSGVLL